MTSYSIVFGVFFRPLPSVANDHIILAYVHKGDLAYGLESKHVMFRCYPMDPNDGQRIASRYHVSLDFIVTCTPAFKWTDFSELQVMTMMPAGGSGRAIVNYATIRVMAVETTHFRLVAAHELALTTYPNYVYVQSPTIQIDWYPELGQKQICQAIQLNGSMINRKDAKGIGPRQRSMPVQIDSELMRIIPKHLRKRVKSADIIKKKNH